MCKIDCYIYKMFYVNLMVTIKQKATVGTQKVKRRESISKWKIISSQRKVVREEEGNKGTTKQPENNKMSLVSPHLISKSSKITLLVNGLNFPMESHRVARWIRKQDPSISAYKRFT